jgi:predicted RNA binding protein with dsRBD fold (UPF0201 family)
MGEITIHVETRINLTESEDKVSQAIGNIFGNIASQAKIQPIYKGGLLTAEMRGREALTKFYNLLRRERIRDAARGVFFEGLEGKTITFYLNKQVAFAGHVSFAKENAESPLGPIKVQIKCENPKELIDWLAPKTAGADKR